MAAFQVVVADPDTGDTYQFDVEDQAATRFLGKTISEDVDGTAVGLDGYTLTITGGSDVTGRPMHENLAGPNLRKVLVAERSTGYRPSRDGERNRVSVRGNEITDDTAQINTKITAYGDQSIASLLGEEDTEDADDIETDEPEEEPAEEPEESDADDDDTEDDQADEAADESEPDDEAEAEPDDEPEEDTDTDTETANADADEADESAEDK